MSVPKPYLFGFEPILKFLLIYARTLIFWNGTSIPGSCLSKVAKHEKICFDNQNVFVQFIFDIFGFLAPENKLLLMNILF
jgi:hypothetical protein